MNIIKLELCTDECPLVCEVPIYKIPPAEPPVSVIIPYKCQMKFYPKYICSNDEVIIVFGSELVGTIGHARIEAVKLATNEWIVQTDSDAIYPPDYLPQIKKYLGDYPVLSTTRTGGLNEIFFKVQEPSLIVKKSVFLERTKNYPADINYRGLRTDIADYFRDAQKIPVTYYHGLTKGEKTGLIIASLILTPIILKI